MSSQEIEKQVIREVAEVEKKYAGSDPEHGVFAQLFFDGIQQQLVKEKAAENDHEDGAQGYGVWMPVKKALYKEDVQQGQRGIYDHESLGQLFVGGVLQV